MKIIHIQVSIVLKRHYPGFNDLLNQLPDHRHHSTYQVAVDGTGMYSFDYEPFEGCPHKSSKNGKKTWQEHVLEAKIVMDNGLSLSIATEWLHNSENLDEKQDCELKAFVRLAKKIKRLYPHLPIILCADGLYPNATVFRLCKQFGWKFIITFKDGSLPSVWEEVGLLYPLQEHHNKQEKLLKNWAKESTMFISDIEYKGHALHWIEYCEYEEGATPQKRFTHLTNIRPDAHSVWDISRHGRLRWCIENEGFNTQKNQGYGLQHKYARKNFMAMQNYYQLLQIAHLINQLTEKLQKVKQGIGQAGTTLKALWEDIMASMQKEVFSPGPLAEEIDKCRQLRY